MAAKPLNYNTRQFPIGFTDAQANLLDKRQLTRLRKQILEGIELLNRHLLVARHETPQATTDAFGRFVGVEQAKRDMQKAIEQMSDMLDRIKIDLKRIKKVLAKRG